MVQYSRLRSPLDYKKKQPPKPPVKFKDLHLRVNRVRTEGGSEIVYLTLKCSIKKLTFVFT